MPQIRLKINLLIRGALPISRTADSLKGKACEAQLTLWNARQCDVEKACSQSEKFFGDTFAQVDACIHTISYNFT